MGSQQQGMLPQRLELARNSRDANEFGSILEDFRAWLDILAALAVDGELQAKLDPQDLVQETLLQACRDRARFRGVTEAELAGWLRGILAHVLAHEVRRFRGPRRREVALQAIEEQLGRSSAGMSCVLADGGASPSARAIREEEGILLARALAKLPKDYREVIVLRSLKDLTHEEVARRLERSPGAVRMLWLRALARLKEEMPA